MHAIDDRKKICTSYESKIESEPTEDCALPALFHRSEIIHNSSSRDFPQSVYLDGIQILKKTEDFIIIESYRILVGILFSQIRIILIIQFVQVLIFWLFPSAFHHRKVERSSVVIGRQQSCKPSL